MGLETQQANRRTRRFPQRGFTLLEVTVALVLVAVILGIAFPLFTGYLAQRRLQNAAFLLLNDLRFAQQNAVARSADSPRVEVCFRTNGYDIYAVRYADPVNRCELVAEPNCLVPSVEMLKTVNRGGEYDATIALAPSPATFACYVSNTRNALAFQSSGSPTPDGAFVALQAGSRVYCVDIEAGTGRTKVRQKDMFAGC